MNDNTTSKGGSFLANRVKAGLSGRDDMRQAPIEDLMRTSEEVEETLPDIDQINQILIPLLPFIVFNTYSSHRNNIAS